MYLHAVKWLVNLWDVLQCNCYIAAYLYLIMHRHYYNSIVLECIHMINVIGFEKTRLPRTITNI